MRLRHVAERGSLNVLCAMLSRMDARQHQDLILTISQAILDARYAPPKRRRSAWGEGYNEDLEQARRVAAVIVEALRRSGFQDLAQATGATSQHAQGPVEAWHPNGGAVALTGLGG